MSKKEQIVQLTNHDNNEDIYPVTMEDAISRNAYVIKGS